MTRHAVSGILRSITHRCTGFGSYFIGVRSTNCGGCPNCRCVEGPSVEEAQKDYQAMLRASNANIW